VVDMFPVDRIMNWGVSIGADVVVGCMLNHRLVRSHPVVDVMPTALILSCPNYDYECGNMVVTIGNIVYKKHNKR
jgi:hypothetical protein